MLEIDKRRRIFRIETHGLWLEYRATKADGSFQMGTRKDNRYPIVPRTFSQEDWKVIKQEIRLYFQNGMLKPGDLHRFPRLENLMLIQEKN